VGEEMIWIVTITAAFFLAIMQHNYDQRTRELKQKHKEVVEKHNELVTKFNSLRLTNKSYTDMIIEKNNKIIELNDRIRELETGKSKTGVLEDFKRYRINK
jgi:hypothetical protein